ncbi:MAG TPA: cupin domain-containing protein [Stellaceae bacterium]|nr:cupin domain-containing protein [Stellaceae bacterium]
MAVATQEQKPDRKALPSAAREAMEQLNAEAAGLNIWLRTQANAPSQRSWFRDTGLEPAGALASGRVAANQMKALPYRWRWKEIGPYLDRISEIARSADVPPIEFADRQQFLLTNPGLGGRLQVTSVIRCAISVYNPGDVAPVHRHTPNASRTILSNKGGYTTIEGERCIAERGDLIFTPTGTWHDHGNADREPVKWADILDFPLLEFLDCNWLDEGFEGALEGNARAQKPLQAAGYSQKLYAKGGLLPSFVPETRGVWYGTAPMLHYRGADIRAALDGLRNEAGDPYEGIHMRVVNPVTGGPVFPTLDYSAQLLRPGEATRFKRETASLFYCVIAGRGATEVGGRRFDWEENDFFVLPNFLWRRHINTGPGDAILYAVSEAPLFHKIAQYRAQGRLPDGTVAELGP